ncbi:hypothetical protein BRD16_09545 [Halobacteriales archaeon SW_6_65_46]|nr:MAG: hypothetical protein BRD16_09545 [Halobacteriales archaeon SW_6_65_46]
MAEFTFLRFDFGDVSVTTGDSPVLDTETDDDTATDDDGGRAWLAALVGLLFLATVAVLVNRRRS